MCASTARATILVPLDFSTGTSTASASAAGGGSLDFSSGGDVSILFQNAGVKGFGDEFWVSSGGSGGGGGGIIMTFAGSGSGLFTASAIPVSWDFWVFSNTQSGGGFQWDYNVTLNGVGTDFAGSGQTGDHISGDGLVATPTFLTSWQLQLTVTLDNSSFGDQMEVFVPQNSLDANTVPEPAALLLFAPGLGYLLLRRRRMKAGTR